MFDTAESIEASTEDDHVWTPPEGAVGSTVDHGMKMRAKFACTETTGCHVPGNTSTPRSSTGLPSVSTNAVPDVVTHGCVTDAWADAVCRPERAISAKHAVAQARRRPETSSRCMRGPSAPVPTT